jgi:hypothetical protein
MAGFEWGAMTKAWTSNEGSSGVVFISFHQQNQEQIHVVKSSSRIAEELYANR